MHLVSQLVTIQTIEREVQNLLCTSAAELADRRCWRYGTAADACGFPPFVATCCAACICILHAAQQVAAKDGKLQASAAAAAAAAGTGRRRQGSAAKVWRRFCTSLSNDKNMSGSLLSFLCATMSIYCFIECNAKQYTAIFFN